MNAPAEYVVAVGSGLTVALVAAMAAGLRSWARRTTAQIDGATRRLERRMDRGDRRVARLAAEQAYDRQRIVRVETALLFAQSPAEGASRALEALATHPAPPGPFGGLGDDLDSDLDPLD